MPPMPYGQQPQQQPLNPLVQNLFRQPQQMQNNVLTKGTLVTFKYSFWIHDPSPLVVLTTVQTGVKLKGINLHYLTYPYVANLLSRAVGNQAFSYDNIRNDNYITSAFRTYKWNGISQIKPFDSQFLLTVMRSVRNIDPTQIEAIRQSVEEQLNRPTNPTADSFTAGNQQGGLLNG